MTPWESLDAICRESRLRFQYRMREGRDWQPWRVTEERGEGCCRDFAWWAIHRLMVAHPSCGFQLLIGDVRGGRHAWVGLVEPDGSHWWGDPTPGHDYPIAPPSSWVRVPLYAYPCDQYGPIAALAQSED